MNRQSTMTTSIFYLQPCSCEGGYNALCLLAVLLLRLLERRDFEISILDVHEEAHGLGECGPCGLSNVHGEIGLYRKKCASMMFNREVETRVLGHDTT